MKSTPGVHVWIAALLAAGSSVGAQTPDPLARYAACPSGGPVPVATAALAPGVRSRPVETMRGRLMVALEQGKRVMFAYPGEDFFANLKVERLPAAGYAQEKQVLIEDFDHTLSGKGDNSRNYALKPTLHGFEIYGMDRNKLEGGVLGLYLFFDDANHDAVTIYFLNQAPHNRFHTLAEYGALRDQFLQSYTECVSKK